MTAPVVPTPPRSRLTRFVPLTAQLRTYRREWLGRDLVAGVVVGALIIPKNLGYAGVAGVPLERGLYAAAVGAIVYAVLGTCRQISTGPSSGIAAVAGGAVLATGVTGPDVATLVAGITLVSGLMFLALAVFRLGWLSQFLSRAVVTGFLFGAAIDVVVGELPKLTGTDAEGKTSFRELWSWLTGLGDAHTATVVVGVVSLVVVFGLHRAAPRVPNALVLVVGGLLASALLDLGDRGVALVGDIPSGLPSLEVPDLGLLTDHAGSVLLAAFALVMIGFSQTAGDARAFAAKHRYDVDIDQESVAQAGANVGAGLLQGMPVSTSLSASSLNDRAGARTGVASLTSGAVVLLALLVLAPLFSSLPKPVLAALIIEAVVMGMMDVPEMRRLRRVSRVDFWVAVAALVATLVVGVLAGVVVGIVLSLLWLVHVVTHPRVTTLGRERGTQVFRDLDEHPGDETVAGVVVLRLDGGLFFATADGVADRVRRASGEAGVRAVVLYLASVTFADSQGTAALSDVVRTATEAGVDVRLAGVRPAVRRVLERDGLVAALGKDHLHGNVHRALAALAGPSPDDDPAVRVTGS
ncbi:SulP family inorganic anion transporter [Luteimicrobium subarcticum]|uniref:SulP family sulfate permease n=1 Tax=Luteimicrobium subarcticum TaxID=620910 RepID=A0A2M8WUN9_9MICO|nr:sulfate permease [Luteimicrobium subarcticum]PJI94652.1 SulP family sulfate permease [Luteimicrobium subarcticum]